MKLKIKASHHSITESDLKTLEQRLNLRLPEQYWSFLLAHNGGWPIPNAFNLKNQSGPYTGSIVDKFLAIGAEPQDDFYDYYNTFKIINKRLPDNLVPIAYDPGGNLICISTSGHDTGYIYFWDHELEEKEDLNRAVDLIAENLQVFLDGLFTVEQIKTNEQKIKDQILASDDIFELEKLLKTGWNIESKNSMGETLLESAATRNQPLLVQFLLSRGAASEKALKTARRLTALNVDRSDIIKIIVNNI